MCRRFFSVEECLYTKCGGFIRTRIYIELNQKGLSNLEFFSSFCSISNLDAVQVQLRVFRCFSLHICV
uniref:Uncharacterized protein n=1 Tax=Rhizophora mucronata TaxID=61149 RepID=A0A2P2PT16_RHIMU